MWDDPKEPLRGNYDDAPPSPYEPYRGQGQREQGYVPGAADGAPGARRGGSQGGSFDPYSEPPGYPRSAYPNNQPPQWPGPGYDQPPQSQRYIPGDPAYQRPARQQRHPYDAPAPPPAYEPRPRRAEPEHRASHTRALPHLPIAHVLLIAGVAAMVVAISQPWGTTDAGVPLYVHDFSNARLAQHGIDAGALAVRTAIANVVAIGVLGAVLILLNTVVTVINHVLGIVGLPGCASLVFFPVLWGGAMLLFVALLAAAGFAGVGAFSNLPVVQGHGFAVAPVAHNGLGFYLWAGGIAAAFLGMLGQLVLRRR